MTVFWEFLIIAPPILIALTFHEFSHAYVANRFGDPTAKQLGRLSLNPLVHLDLLGTAMLFVVHIGWAKPVPVHPLYFKNPKRDLLWVSLAGPASNLLLAFFFGLLCRAMRIESLRYIEPGIMGIFHLMVAAGLIFNIILAIFNLLPIPPLDGSKILLGLAPKEYEQQLIPYLRYGPTILIALIAFGYLTKISIFGMVLDPLVKFFSYLFAGADLSF